MARANQNLGALGSLTQGQYGDLSRGFEMTNPSGLNLGGIGVSKGSALGYGLGLTGNPAISALGTVAQGITSYNAEKAAQSALGQNRGFVDTVTGMVTDPSLDTARSMADVNKDGVVSKREAQNFGMNQGKLTSYNVGLNPMSGYTKGTVGVTNLGKIDPSGGVLGGYEARTTTPSIYTQQQVDNISSGIGSGVGATGDLGGATGSGYTGSKGIGLGFGRSEGVDPSQSSQTGAETSVTDTTSGKDLSNTFSDDAASSSDSSTYICTALYEMGDMKKYIYKYDQIYGKRVDPLVYKGYCVWGEYVATKMRDKGIVYKITKPLALAWAKQMAYDLSKGRYGKKSKVVKVISKVGEGICYALGFVSNIKQLIGEKYG
jgi:hypothetical protein